jgi:hypothetical protein
VHGFDLIGRAWSDYENARAHTQADLFTWAPDRRYDVVFFGFWLSHVPLERFESFWSLVADCLKADGRVFFVDDAYRTPDELIHGASSSIIRRRLDDGTSYRAVKVHLSTGPGNYSDWPSHATRTAIAAC